MMPDYYKNYISDSYNMMYDFMGLDMFLVPFNHSAGKDKQGRPVIAFMEDLALPIKGSFEESTLDNPDADVKGTVRADARIRIVMKAIRDANRAINVWDAIDVVFPEGKKRYVVTGFDTPPSPSYIFSLPIVTDVEKAFKK